MNSKEYGYPLSKKGLLRGYIKYGVFTYMAWHYFKVAITPSDHGHGHGHGDHGHHGAALGDHGHGHAAAHGHDSHGKKEAHHH